MMQLSWLFLGVLAAIATGVAVWIATTTSADGEQPPRHDLGVIGGLVGFLAWSLWAYGAFTVHIPDHGGGAPIEVQYPALALFGVALAVLALMATIDHAMSLLNPDESEGLVREWGRTEDGRRY